MYCIDIHSIASYSIFTVSVLSVDISLFDVFQLFLRHFYLSIFSFSTFSVNSTIHIITLTGNLPFFVRPSYLFASARLRDHILSFRPLYTPSISKVFSLQKKPFVDIILSKTVLNPFDKSFSIAFCSLVRTGCLTIFIRSIV